MIGTKRPQELEVGIYYVYFVRMSRGTRAGIVKMLSPNEYIYLVWDENRWSPSINISGAGDDIFAYNMFHTKCEHQTIDI
jgi:hypothetical protein